MDKNNGFSLFMKISPEAQLHCNICTQVVHKHPLVIVTGEGCHMLMDCLDH